jgi:hypothetical protein
VAQSQTQQHAREYIDGAVSIQQRAGRTVRLSTEDYEAAVKRAEDALRDAAPAASEQAPA